MEYKVAHALTIQAYHPKNPCHTDQITTLKWDILNLLEDKFCCNSDKGPVTSRYSNIRYNLATLAG